MLGFKTGVIRKKGEEKESLVRSRACRGRTVPFGEDVEEDNDTSG